MPASDLTSYATSTTDFYALLSLPTHPVPSQSDLDRAWRRTALKYHPDKVGASDTAAAEKFHLAQIAYDVLSDPAVKALYDNAREARERKKRQTELFEGERRRMKEELEGRERGVKRGRDEMQVDGEGAFERELRRLAEDGKRRRKEREEALRREMREEIEKQHQEANDSHATTSVKDPLPFAPVSEIDRTIKARWPLSPLGATIDPTRLTTLFSRFGAIENAFLLKPKTARLGPKREKKQVATGVVVYASIVGAHAAVEDAKKQTGTEWALFDSVFWAANKEPDIVAADGISRPGTPAQNGTAPTTPASRNVADFLKARPSAVEEETPQSPSPSPAPRDGVRDGDGLRKVPSFASFSSAGFGTPKGSPMGKGVGVGSPSLEELTMIRLRNAEKRRLEAEIVRGDEDAEKAGGWEGW